MPADVRKTNLLNKLGNRVQKAHELHKNDETKYGMVDLPAGITGGIARLAVAKIDEYKEGKNKGELYAMFRGIAITPETHNDVRVKGQGVMMMVPLCETTRNTKDGPKTISFDDNWGVFLNELRKLGINTQNMPHTAVDAVLLGLEKSKPLFRFSTRGWTPPPSQREPNPKEMVFVQYDGALSPEDSAAFEGQAAAPEAGFAPKTGGDGEGDNENGVQTAPADDDFDLATIASQAEQGDMSAVELIKDKARELGITENEIDESSSWMTQGEGTSLQELIEAKMSGETASESEPEPEPEWEPKVGGVCNYRIKAGGKAIQVKVDKIDAKSGTATLTNLADKKKIEKVPLAKLSAA